MWCLRPWQGCWASIVCGRGRRHGGQGGSLQRPSLWLGAMGNSESWVFIPSLPLTKPLKDCKGCLALAEALKLSCGCFSLFCLPLLFKLQRVGMLTSFYQAYYIFYALDWHSVKFPAGDTGSGIMNHVIQTACNYKRINGNARMLKK